MAVSDQWFFHFFLEIAMKTVSTGLLWVTLALISGCSPSTPDSPVAAGKSIPASNPYVVAVEPAGAVPVGDARKSAKDGETVVLVGHIGGSKAPFVDGLAAFTIVDPKVPWCHPGEGCPTPWDYCCTQNDVQDNIATVKVVNEAGKPVSGDARTLLGVKELSLVVVEGKAGRDAEGNLSVLASRVFVRPQE